jgi:hypothetical protein
MKKIIFQYTWSEMRITLNNITYEVHPNLEEGTFLHTLNSTGCGSEKDTTGSYILKDITEEYLVSYLSYLNGETEFEWNEEVMDFFDLMGHPNTCGYPLDFYKVKLVHERITGLELYRSFKVGHTSRPIRYVLGNSVHGMYNLQVGTDMVMSCYGLWSTYLGKYCLEEGVNWYEPDKHSVSYIRDLIKARYEIRIPGMEGRELNMDMVRNIEEEVLFEYYASAPNDDDEDLEDNVMVNVAELLELYNIHYPLEGPLDCLKLISESVIDYPKIYEFLDNNFGDTDILHKYGLVKSKPDPMKFIVKSKPNLLVSYPKELSTNLLLQYKFGYSFIDYPGIYDDGPLLDSKLLQSM